MVVGVASAGAVTGEAFLRNGDGDDGFVVDRRGRAVLEQLSVRLSGARHGVAALIAVEPGDVVAHARRTGEVRPREVRDDASLDRELSEQVAPTSEESFLFTPRFDDELWTRHRDHRGEGSAVTVAEGTEAASSPPVDVDDVDAVEARWHRRGIIPVGPQRQRCLPAPTASHTGREPAHEQGQPLPAGVTADAGEAHRDGHHNRHRCDRQWSADGQRTHTEDDPCAEEPALHNAEAEEHAGGVERFELVVAVGAFSSHRDDLLAVALDRCGPTPAAWPVVRGVSTPDQRTPIRSWTLRRWRRTRLPRSQLPLTRPS